MKRDKLYFIFIMWVVTISLMAFPVGVHADDGGPKGDQIIFGRNFTLKSGEILEGNLAVMAGTVTLEEGSTLTGDIFVAGGAIWIYGEVEGSLVTLGGGVYLGEDAIVDNDVVVLGGAFNRADGAVVGGQIMTSIPSGAKLFSPPALSGIHVPRLWVDVNPLWNIPKGLFESFVWAVLGALLVLFLPIPTERVAKAINSQPALAGGFGLLTIVILPFIAVVLLITIILIPLIPLVILVLLFALIFGWVSLGYEVGRRLAEQLHVQWAMSVSAGVGILLVTVVAKAIGSIACIGWVAPFIFLMLGLGGVILTRFGSQEYISNGSSQVGQIPSTTQKPPLSSIPTVSSEKPKSENTEEAPSGDQTIAANDLKGRKTAQSEKKGSPKSGRSKTKETQNEKVQPDKPAALEKSAQSADEEKPSTSVKKTSITSRRKKEK